MGHKLTTPLLFNNVPWRPSDVITLQNGRRLRGKAFIFSDTQFASQLTGAKNDAAHKTQSSTVINAFLGIPFAKPPVGDLRFRKPEPAVEWPLNEVLECTKFGPRCPHEDMWTEVFAGLFYPKSEDCLRLNVFAPPPSTTSVAKLPVMVFIHGGGFIVHSAAHYGDVGICRNLCTKGVIVVTIQYRLGFFGFLCTGDEHAPGNMGLWDQALALRWVHDNIGAFGGDAENVTVFGQSAGGASADFLAVSPHSRDLFQKMILMSGSASCSFALNTAERVRAASIKFAEECGFKLDQQASISEQNQALVEFYRKQSANSLELSMIGKHGHSINRNGVLDLVPVIDGDFLPRPLHELRKEAPKKQIITGITEYEGLIFSAFAPRKNSLRSEAHKVIAQDLNSHGISSAEMINPRIKELYFKNIDENDHAQMTLACIKAASDVFIVNGVWAVAEEMSQLDHTVYLYSFDHFHMRTFGVVGFLFPFKGATHGSELPYLFHKGIIGSFHQSPEELEISRRFTNFFVNFAKYGNPNEPNGESPDSEHYWRPLNDEHPQQYIRICATYEATKMAEGNFCDGRPAVWRQLITTKAGTAPTPSTSTDEELLSEKEYSSSPSGEDEEQEKVKDEEARIFDIPKRQTGVKT